MSPLVLSFMFFMGGAGARAPTANYTQQIAMSGAPADDVLVSPLGTSAATPVAAFGDTNDVASGDRKAYVQQNIVITNLSDVFLCMKATTAVADCGVLTMTCNAAGANNGQPIPAGAQRSFRVTGLEKACVLAPVAATGKTFIAERTLRLPY